MGDFVDYALWQRAPAGYVPQVLWDLTWRTGAAMRQQQDSCFRIVRICAQAELIFCYDSAELLAEYSCTNLANAFTFSTGVSGKIP